METVGDAGRQGKTQALINAENKAEETRLKVISDPSHENIARYQMALVTLQEERVINTSAQMLYKQLHPRMVTMQDHHPKILVKYTFDDDDDRNGFIAECPHCHASERCNETEEWMNLFHVREEIRRLLRTDDGSTLTEDEPTLMIDSDYDASEDRWIECTKCGGAVTWPFQTEDL